MKIRAIGTGSSFCRHPLVTSSFLIQSEESNVLIGCGPNIPAKLETINLSIEQIDMFILLNSRMDHVGGLEEVWTKCKDKKPFLVAPAALFPQFRENRIFDPIWESFEVRAISKVSLNEEHYSETIRFVKNYLGGQPPSYSLCFDEAEVFISGTTDLNDEFLHRNGMPAEIVLHQCITPSQTGVGTTLQALQELPVYLQQKIWLYGYGNDYLSLEEPLPMLFLPQGTCVYDSERKDKHLEKERFIRENSKRQIGNLTAS